MLVGLCFLAFAMPANAQLFNYRYNPNDLDVPTQLTLPQNVRSVAFEPTTESIATVGNFVHSSNNRGMLHVTDGAGLQTFAYQDMHASHLAGEYESFNSVIFPTSGSDNVMMAGLRSTSSITDDLYITKRRAVGSNYVNVWGITIGNVGSFIEEARVLVQGAGNKYFVAGVTNQYGGVNSPFIAMITDNGSLASLDWAYIYPVSDGAEPTSVFRTDLDEYYVVGEHGSNELFAFKVNNLGILQTPYYRYSSGPNSFDRTPHIDQDVNGNTVISYTTGSATTPVKVIGLMNVNPNLASVNWNYHYAENSSALLYATTVTHSTSGLEYAISMGYASAPSFSDSPGLLRTDLSGKPIAAIRYNVDTDFERNQSMVPYDDGYILKNLYKDLEGHGLIKVDVLGYGDNADDVCETLEELVYGEVEINIQIEHPDDYTATNVNSSGIGNFINRSGTITDCDGSFLAAYKRDDKTGINEVTVAGAFSVYPNPNNGQFVLKVENGKPYTYRVLNGLGQEVQAASFETGTEVTMDIADKGVYLLEVSQNGEVYTQKVVIK